MTSTQPFCSLKSRPLLAIGNNAQLRQFNYNTLFNPRQTSVLECSNSYNRSKCRSQASSEGHMLNLKACWLYRMNKLTFHHWYLTFLLIFLNYLAALNGPDFHKTEAWVYFRVMFWGNYSVTVLLSDFRFSALYKEVSPSAGQTQGLLSSAGAQRQTEPAHKSSPPWLTGSVKYI